MKFITHNDASGINTNFTHLQGYIDASYDDLCRLFGKPEFGDYKTDWEWTIEFEDGTVATIYNWKNGPNYGASHVTPDMVNEWNVGGHNRQSIKNLNALL